VIARVEPLTRARALRGPFDYRLGGELAGVEVGDVLQVPFGPRKILGVVTALTSESALPDERLAEPLGRLAPGTTAELVELGLWVAREYCSTPARGLALVTAPGTGTGQPGIGARAVSATLVRMSDSGRTALSEGERLGPSQRALLAAVGTGEIEAGRLARIAGTDRAALRRLARRGFVELRQVPRRRAPVNGEVGARPAPVAHTPAQRDAIGRAIAALPAARNGSSQASARELLLHGVTGSGKTEVYLAVAEAAIARGLSVIALVPEISLTPQNVTRFRARLGERIAVLHSGLTAGERFDEWGRLRSGEAVVAVGPRSAVFAPVSDLGLVILDEEHDSSYKQESDPRYDARDVARRRAGESGALLLAGSATPRPESWHSMERVSLPERADGSPLPAVEVLDMRGTAGEAGPFHEVSRRALAETCAAGGKAMVLLNRRGWSPHMECRGCGRAWRCPNCDVSLVLHRGSPPRLRCHHCAGSEPVPSACPDCGSVSIARHGVGTERLAEIVAGIAGTAPVFRLDADTAGRAGHGRLLAEFEKAPTGVLVGTQMLAKGHDFAGLGLGIVVDADATLRFPDFRSEERTFALVAQLAGRIGRGGAAGRVLVQTLDPGADAIAFAARHDAAGFLAAELERRRALGYPPFSHLVRIEIGADSEAAAMRACAGLADKLKPGLGPDTVVLGPAPRFRVRGKSRAQLLIKGPHRTGVAEPVRAVVDEAVAAGHLKGLAISVDVDPQG
jgi:primosomal protein N' (replication factor Y)